MMKMVRKSVMMEWKNLSDLKEFEDDTSSDII